MPQIRQCNASVVIRQVRRVWKVCRPVRRSRQRPFGGRNNAGGGVRYNDMGPKGEVPYVQVVIQNTFSSNHRVFEVSLPSLHMVLPRPEVVVVIP